MSESEMSWGFWNWLFDEVCSFPLAINDFQGDLDASAMLTAGGEL